MATTRKYELYDAEFQADPYAVYAQMREQDPVLLQPGIDGETLIWFVTRYEDVAAILVDAERFVRDPRLALTEQELEERQVLTNPLVDNHMLNRDGADHRRLRRLVTQAFTPKRVASLRPRIQEITDELLDAVESRGEMDLVAEFAFPLPIRVIAELLGVAHEDRDRLRAWSSAFVTPDLSDGAQERLAEQIGEFVGYLNELFERRRAEPRDDLISALLQAEEAGDHLDQAELFSMVVLLIIAGHETTVNLIANGALALVQQPEKLEQLRAQPELLPAAVEELLRYDGPVDRTLARWAAEDVEVGGRSIKRGDAVIVSLGSAGRDRERFPDADALELARADNKHLAFGRGPHYCLGAPLARLEGEIALGTLLRRLPGLRLAVPVEELAWRPTPAFRALVSLPVAW